MITDGLVRCVSLCLLIIFEWCLLAGCSSSAVDPELRDPFAVSEMPNSAREHEKERTYVIVPSLADWPPSVTVWTVRPKGETTQRVRISQKAGIRVDSELIDAGTTSSVWKAVRALRDSDRLILTCDEPMLMTSTGVWGIVRQPRTNPVRLPPMSIVSTFQNPTHLWDWPLAYPCSEWGEVDDSVQLLCGILDALSSVVGRNVAVSAPAVFCSDDFVTLLDPCMLTVKIAQPSDVFQAQRYVGELLGRSLKRPVAVNTAAAIAAAWEELLNRPGVTIGHPRVLYVDLKRNMVVVRASQGFAAHLASALRSG